MPENRSDNQGLSLHREERARSISRGFVTAVGVSVLFVCVLGIFASVFYTSFKARNSLEKKADEYIDSLGENLEIPLWSLNEPVIRRIGKSFVHNDLVTRVKIIVHCVIGRICKITGIGAHQRIMQGIPVSIINSHFIDVHINPVPICDSLAIWSFQKSDTG